MDRSQDQPTARQDNPSPLTIGRRIDSRAEAVSDFLQSVGDAVARAGHAAARDGTWEIVLAEALNNVVEHAYGETPGHAIAIDLRFDAVGLHAMIEDRGAPMPGGILPDGTAPEVDAPPQDLPEGGFGWHLIHSLTTALHYTRASGANRLQFTVPLERS